MERSYHGHQGRDRSRDFGSRGQGGRGDRGDRGRGDRGRGERGGYSNFPR